MARSDQERWDLRYADGDWQDSEGASAVVERALPWLVPPGLVLDAACGAGRNSLFLANYGFKVIAVDISWSGLHVVAKRARRRGLPVLPLHADLEHFAIPDVAFDVIVNTRFLMREMFPQYEAALAPGGLLIFETYHVSEIDELGGDISREYALEDGELGESFNGLEILLYEEGILDTMEGERGLARIIARKSE